jgi:hypothetical protein
MAEFYFTVNLDNERTLYLAPLTDRRIAMAGIDVGDTSGYFLFEKCGTGDLASIEVIARVLTEDAALRLRDMLNMA